MNNAKYAVGPMFLILLLTISGFGGVNTLTIRETSMQTVNTAMISSNETVNKKRRPQRYIPLGTWGGEHIRMVVSAKGASIEYDCAHGSIVGRLTLDAERKFNATGAHMREGPGPIRMGVPRASRPAVFSGQVNGDEMSLTVTLTDEKQSLGDFTLRRGSEGHLRKCR